jgi:hypothetical protein
MDADPWLTTLAVTSKAIWTFVKTTVTSVNVPNDGLNPVTVPLVLLVGAVPPPVVSVNAVVELSTTSADRLPQRRRTAKD